MLFCKMLYLSSIRNLKKWVSSIALFTFYEMSLFLGRNHFLETP